MYDSIIILGPTATGKTGVSIKLAHALNTEIINADSMYIYKQLNIGTAKPTIEEMDNVKHHLIDIVNPDESFNVAEYRVLAKNTLFDFFENKKIPIIVGGTGFYIDSLISNYSYGNAEKNIDLRNELENFAMTNGNESLYKKLCDLSPDVASKYHYNDKKRVIRAIELLMSNNSDFANYETPLLKNPLIIGLNFPREILYDRINKRVDIMVNNGLIDEVKELYQLGYLPDKYQAMKGIGYKEIFDYLDNKCSLVDAIDKIKQHTRNYAKRQITWFKRNDKIHWFNMSDYYNLDGVINDILDIYYTK